VQGRVTDRSELLGASEKAREHPVDPSRLANADLDGPSITLSYMADDKSHVRRSVIISDLSKYQQPWIESAY
jgi:hypothetical protein